MKRCVICQHRLWGEGSLWNGTASCLKFVQVHPACKQATDDEYMRGLAYGKEYAASQIFNIRLVGDGHLFNCPVHPTKHMGHNNGTHCTDDNE